MENRIITFDLASEEFGEVCLPDCLATTVLINELYISSKPNESSLVVIACPQNPDFKVLSHVWRMEEHGLFKKLYTIEAPFEYFVTGFRMNGHALIERVDIPRPNKSLVQVYDPSTRQIKDNHIGQRFCVTGCYTETLLLLNHQSISSCIGNKRDNEMQSTDQMDHVAGLKGSDVDGSFGGEEDYYEDEDSDSEYASIQRPAFYVSGEPDFDSGPPQDGLEYLRRVRWETKHIPKVKVAKVDKSVLNKEQTVYMPRIPDIAVCPEHLMPSKEWENVFLADFSKLRMRRFSLPQGDNVDKVLLDTFNEKFRSLKKRLKDKLLKLAAKKLDEANIGGDDVQYTMDDLLNALDMVSPPENFVDHQWEVFKNNLRSPTAKKLSKYGKDARAGKLHYHSTGAVSFARKKDEFMVINKREANDVEFFEDSHLMKDGKYAKHASEELLNQAKEGIARKISEVSSFDSIDPEKRSEIVREVMKELRGRSKRGRLPGYGAGVKRSQVSKFRFDLRKLRGKTIENENQYLLDKVDTQSKQIESQRIQIETQSKQIENQSNQMSKMQKTLDQCTGELQLFRTAFSDFCGPRMSIPPQATSSAFHQDHR